MKETLSKSSPFVLGALASYVANHIPIIRGEPIPLVAAGLTVFCALTVYLNGASIRAYLRLFTVARFRGVWGQQDIRKQIEADYKKASKIKIRVTRGFSLFLPADGIFNELIKKRFPNKRKIQLLLHYPCLESQHLVRRAQANRITPAEYVANLFEVLKLLRSHSADIGSPDDISVRFYRSGQDSDWRYYIFEDEHGSRALYFNHYDDSTAGAKSRMLKVADGNHSLCDELDKNFDELFTNNSIEIIENVRSQDRLLNSNYCGHPRCREMIEATYRSKFKNNG